MILVKLNGDEPSVVPPADRPSITMESGESMFRLQRFEHRLMRSLTALLAELSGSAAAANDEQPAAAAQKPVPIVLMISGGRDSMALLHAVAAFEHSNLFALKGLVRFHVLHCDHRTRAGQSTKDAAFVTRQALARGFPVHHALFASGHHLSPSKPTSKPLGDRGPTSFQRKASEWRRKERHRLSEVLGQGCVFVTAHHAADRAEGLLLNLLRGTGAHGLSGIKRVCRKERMIRPLLDVPHEDLLKYSLKNQIEHCEDASNTDTRYTRNAVRHELLPFLRRFNPNIEAALTRLSDQIEPLTRPATATSNKDLLDPEPGGQKTLTCANQQGSQDFLQTQNNIRSQIRSHHGDYDRFLTFGQLNNLAHHLHWCQQRKQDCTVPLSHGWKAKLGPKGLDIIPPSCEPQL